MIICIIIIITTYLFLFLFMSIYLSFNFPSIDFAYIFCYTEELGSHHV